MVKIGRKKKTKQVNMQDEQIPSGVQEIFEQHKRKASFSRFMESQGAIRKHAMFHAIMTLLLMYLILPVSRIQSVVVTGNTFLSKQYIGTIAGIQENDVYYFKIPFLCEASLKNHPFIKDAKVKLVSNNTVDIQISEKKPVGYIYEDEPIVIFADGTSAKLEEDYLTLIADIPLITGFKQEDIPSLGKALNQVTSAMIRNISEISIYALSYDDYGMKVLMRNGGYFFGTYRSIDKLNYFYSVYNREEDKSMCVSGSETTSNAWYQVCPWNETNVAEYWTDDAGNIIKNTYGDDVVKHYYYDEKGNLATDGSGNGISIPIDEKGLEVRDEDFLEHYENGYYSSGVLVLPE